MLAVLKRMKNTVGNGSTFKNSNNDAVNGPIKFRTDKAGFVQLNLHVKPGAKVTKVAEINENHIGLQVKNYFLVLLLIFWIKFRFLHRLEMEKLMKK
jgi:hypothetical protein